MFSQIADSPSTPQVQLLIYRDSDGNSYQTIQQISPGETLNILAFPDVSFNSSDILG